MKYLLLIPLIFLLACTTAEESELTEIPEFETYLDAQFANIEELPSFDESFEEGLNLIVAKPFGSCMDCIRKTDKRVDALKDEGFGNRIIEKGDITIPGDEVEADNVSVFLVDNEGRVLARHLSNPMEADDEETRAEFFDLVRYTLKTRT